MNVNATTEDQADVVVMIDTSQSMTNAGMDPERASVLVAKLFSDVVPSSLSIVRLFDLEKDKHLIETKKTGQMSPCPERPSTMCETLEIVSDLQKTAYEKKIGVMSRPRPRDLKFKKQLEVELTATSTTSPFSLALISVARIFEERRLANPENRQILVWLSDGRTDNTQAFNQQISILKSDGVEIHSVIFGSGSTDVSKEAGIDYSIATTPLELMTIFADLLRQIVGAPIDNSGQLQDRASFNIPAEIKQAWVVVYGDTSLSSVELRSPTGHIIAADFASDIQNPAGAYRVAHVKSPTEGLWSISARGGGEEAAYAVILDSSLYPFLLPTNKFIIGAPQAVFANIKSTLTNQIVNDLEIVGDATIKATINNQELTMNDQGMGADDVAGDFVYSAELTLHEPGISQLKLLLNNHQTNSSRLYDVVATGLFEYNGKGLNVDFGELNAGDSNCRPVNVSEVSIQGRIPMNFVELKSAMPAGHSLSATLDGINPNIIFSDTDNAFEICISVSRRGISTNQVNLHTANLQGPNRSQGDTNLVPIFISWTTVGLSFWERWRNWIYLLLVILLVCFIVAGIILPKRFRSSLHVVTGDSLQELAEHIPTQIKIWKGTRAGFYKNAQAFIHSDHRISGKNTNAAVSISIDNNSLIIAGINGYVLHRKKPMGDWEPIENGSYRMGNALRIGANGLLFKLVDV